MAHAVPEKSLFVLLYCDTPHLETDLELMADLLEDGRDVHVLRCTGELGTCLKNPEHKAGWCKICVSKIDGGLHAIRQRKLRVEVMRPVAADPRLPARFASADELKLYSLDGANIGRGVYSSLCSRLNKDTTFDTDKHAAEVRRELEAAWQVYVSVGETIERINPDAVYVFNGRFSIYYPVLLACQRRKVRFITHERGGTPDKYWLHENTLPHHIAANQREMLALWDAAGPEMIEIGRKWFHDRRAGSEQSWLSFTKAQSVGRLPQGFDPSRKNIAIFSSTLEEYAAIEGWENPLYPDEIVGLKAIVESLQSHDLHLYLRVHPNLKNIARENNAQLREYSELERRAKNLTVIWPESPVHTYALLDACALALTFGSTVGVEACFWKKPSILAGRALYEGLDCAHAPKSHGELIALLTGTPACKREEGALKYGHWEHLRGTPFRRFTPTGLFTGTFEGKSLQPSLRSRFQSALMTAFGL